MLDGGQGGQRKGVTALYPRVEENTGVQDLFGIPIPVWIYTGKNCIKSGRDRLLRIDQLLET